MLELNTEIAKVLATASAERERNRVQIALDACLQLLPDRKDEIDRLFDSEKRKVAVENVQLILGSEIEESIKGKMIVPEYSQKGSAKQQIYVYVGTHWELCLTQIYYDFMKDACRKIGLSEVYVQSQYFMNVVFENVAFRVSQHICTVQPHEGVWINLRNCTVEINNDGSVCTHPHRSEDFFLYCLQYDYNPQATCPKWHEFLDEVLPEKEAQMLLGEYIGYCFTQNLKLEKMAVFYGGGANGKSVTLDVIKNLVGKSNVSEGTLSSITNDPETRALLQNKLVNISSESNKNLNPAVLKMLISGEPVEIRILYVGTKLLTNPPKLITSYNELPPIENTYGYRRRWILFPFDNRIPAERQDHALAGKLCMELSGILNWVIGLLGGLVMRVNSYTGEDFTSSSICNSAVEAYFQAANSAMLFLEENCKKDDTVLVPMKELYQKYVSYCKMTGISKPCILKNFKKALKDWGAKESVKCQVKYFNVAVDTSNYI